METQCCWYDLDSHYTPACGWREHQTTYERQGRPRETGEAHELSAELHLIDDLQGGRAQQVGDELQLVHHIATREQRLAQQHLRKDAANRPDVDCWAVLCKERAAQLRRTVPESRRAAMCQDDKHMLQHSMAHSTGEDRS
jgi:hypothetical protein